MRDTSRCVPLARCVTLAGKAGQVLFTRGRWRPQRVCTRFAQIAALLATMTRIKNTSCLGHCHCFSGSRLMTPRTLFCSFMLAVSSGVTACSPSIHAEDWLQFRGTAGDGDARLTSLPTKWSSTENVRWRCEVPGEGWSSPVVQGKQIYLTAAVPSANEQTNERELCLLQIDGDTGSITKRIKLFEQPASAPRSIRRTVMRVPRRSFVAIESTCTSVIKAQHVYRRPETLSGETLNSVTHRCTATVVHLH